MIHSGYSGFGLLSSEFAAATAFVNKLPIKDQSSLLDSAGNKLTTKRVHIPQFEIGNENLLDVPFSFFEGALGKRRFNVLGCDFIRRFNWCFDLKEQCVYLRKNTHFDAEYFPSEKNS